MKAATGFQVPRLQKELRLHRCASAALLAACGMLSACISGLKSNVPVQQLYYLHAPLGSSAPAPAPAPASTAPASAAATSKPALEVLRPISMPSLDTDGIAVLRTGNRLDYFTASRWSAAAPLLVQALAIDVLRGSGRFRAVEPDGTPFLADQLLRIEMRHFEAEYSDEGPPTIHVTLVATTGLRSGRTLLGSVRVDSSIKADSDRMQAVVSAFEHATGEALNQLLAQWPPG